jgi:hypothetical protein
MSELFVNSFKMHQKLVDVMLEYQNENGVCTVSRAELAKRMDRSAGWVDLAIKKINTEDICIDSARDGYIVRYSSLKDKGVFHEILEMMLETAVNQDFFFLQDRYIAEKRQIQLKTVQMFKTYFRDNKPMNIAASENE